MRLVPRLLIGGMGHPRSVIESREDRHGEFPQAADATGRALGRVRRMRERADIVELTVLGTAMRIGRHGSALTKRATGRRRKAP